MLTRIVAFVLLTTFLFSGGAAAENLAMAITQFPEAKAQDSEASGIRVDRVEVRKGERRIYLMSDGEAVRSYRIALGDNPIGHKLFEGDERTPEGEYTLDWRNPGSRFHKSIHVSYPNTNDRQDAAAWGLDPGGQIMIHGLPNDVGDMAFAYTGLDWTDGCIAVSNAAIDEIWSLVSDGTPIKIYP